jgi:hypothetical protein
MHSREEHLRPWWHLESRIRIYIWRTTRWNCLTKENIFSGRENAGIFTFFGERNCRRASGILIRSSSRLLVFVASGKIINGGNTETLPHHGMGSMANWRPAHCLPNVPGKRTDAYSMSSVHWSIEMRRKLVTPPLCLFRNQVRTELS